VKRSTHRKFAFPRRNRPKARVASPTKRTKPRAAPARVRDSVERRGYVIAAGSTSVNDKGRFALVCGLRNGGEDYKKVAGMDVEAG